MCGFFTTQGVSALSAMFFKDQLGRLVLLLSVSGGHSSLNL